MAAPSTAPRLIGARPRLLLDALLGLARPTHATPPTATLREVPRTWTNVLVALLVLVPVLFNAIVLLPELQIPVPSLNDDAFHYLFIQRASQALSNGEAPFDMWSPVLELGFPAFEFYQHVPHLTIVLLNRLLLGQVSLLTLFNLSRYLLMAGFPLTVFWSTRRLGFSPVAAGVSAATSSLIAGGSRFGFEYDSYVWRGYGMYTQLWAMNLSFIVLACLDTLLKRGRGYLAAILTCSLLVLSHLLYAEFMVLNAVILTLIGLNRRNLGPRLFRLVCAGGIVALITSYFWVTFLHFQPFSNVSPYLQPWKPNSFGAGTILTWLVTGQLFDSDRLPVFTLLLALGILMALIVRSRPALIALAIFVVWLVLYFGRNPWGPVIDLLPASNHLLLHRLIGGVDLGAIMLIGLGGELIWRLLTWQPRLSARLGVAATAAVLLVFFVPAFLERQGYYDLNTQWMQETLSAIDNDQNARTILATIQQLPNARVYAGLRTDWGANLTEGGVYFSDLLTFYQIPAVSPPYNEMSLNSDLLWHFDDQQPADYDIFNARWVVAPTGATVPSFLKPIKVTTTDALYEAPSTGYGEFVAIEGREAFATEPSLFDANRDWLLSGQPSQRQFIRIDYPAPAEPLSGAATPICPDGSISHEQMQAQELDLTAYCSQPSTLVLKMTYHPNWHVTVDGQPVQTFMVSPSLIGIAFPAGEHFVLARYEPPLYEYVLIVLGVLLILAAIVLRAQFSVLEHCVTDARWPDWAGLRRAIPGHGQQAR